MARVRGDGHVPLLSRLEILEIKTHVFDKANGSTTRIFSRDCLEVTLALPGKRRLHVLINHFK
ncbi:MAG TPA: hypothetical protein VJT73_09925 [Polyangiaceae bacterium]|nr:hypothetical protein [Polyangiaceae bacterium]